VTGNTLYWHRFLYIADKAEMDEGAPQGACLLIFIDDLDQQTSRDEQLNFDNGRCVWYALSNQPCETAGLKVMEVGIGVGEVRGRSRKTCAAFAFSQEEDHYGCISCLSTSSSILLLKQQVCRKLVVMTLFIFPSLPA
jgi:hypothetical protein